MSAAAVRLVSYNGTDVLYELRDPDEGLFVETVQEPEDAVRDIRTSSPYVSGSFRVAEVDDDGFLVVLSRIEAASWAAVAAKWLEIRAAYRAEPVFYIETEFEGVTTRWLTERPDVSPAETSGVNLGSFFQTYAMRFRVQPNPTVNIA